MTRMLLFVAAIVALSAGTSDARPRPERGKRFESNKVFGLGLELGAPFGLTGKYFLGEGSDRAIDFGIGDIGPGYYGDRSGLHIYGDYLFHPVSLASNESFELPLFVGVGARYWNFDYTHANGYAFGIRAPIGIAFDLNNAPLDIFVQFAFVLDFVHGYTHDVWYDGDFSVGIRFWF